MAAEKSPAFQFYPRDFLTDVHVVAMSNAERGMYMTLLCHCWLEGSLPADPRVLAKLVNEPLDRFREAWHGAIKVCFSTAPAELPIRSSTGSSTGTCGRLVQKRLETERERQVAFREKQARNGRLGGRPGNPRVNLANPSQSSSSSSSSSIKNKLVQTPVQVVPSTACGRQKTDADDEPLTRQETTLAERILKTRFGRCEHDPPCHNVLACTNKVAYEIRAKRNGG